MNLSNQVEAIFNEGISLKSTIARSLAPKIAAASQILADCIKSGGKILSCGNGGSACDAAHFTAEIANRFLMERDGLPAVTLNSDTALLTAIANDYSYQDIFSRQIKALGRKHDVLLAISTSGKSPNVIRGIEQAQECGLKVIALTGRDGGPMAKTLKEADIEIRVPSQVTPRIQEVHILIIHCLCELLDKILFEKV